jgi:hypothetical protein
MKLKSPKTISYAVKREMYLEVSAVISGREPLTGKSPEPSPSTKSFKALAKIQNGLL